MIFLPLGFVEMESEISVRGSSNSKQANKQINKQA